MHKLFNVQVAYFESFRQEGAAIALSHCAGVKVNKELQLSSGHLYTRFLVDIFNVLLCILLFSFN